LPYGNTASLRAYGKLVPPLSARAVAVGHP
jgi:hypothetical protein